MSLYRPTGCPQAWHHMRCTGACHWWAVPVERDISKYPRIGALYADCGLITSACNLVDMVLITYTSESPCGRVSYPLPPIGLSLGLPSIGISALPIQCAKLLVNGRRSERPQVARVDLNLETVAGQVRSPRLNQSAKGPLSTPGLNVHLLGFSI